MMKHVTCFNCNLSSCWIGVERGYILILMKHGTMDRRTNYSLIQKAKVKDVHCNKILY